ncbi:MAG: V-type ATP synthase subunit D [Thermoplasmata archaeon]|nr:V-type ATP synthase subunit D [Candidatus Thermoplasmatota archaeon]MCK4948612.1 V-type ATP synthase subunit D [Thermoplasmata archaeon]
MVREYKATRSELIELKKQIKLSTTGHRLLKMKRDSLIAEFFNILDKAKGIRSGIQDKYDRAMERLSIAKAIEGTIGVKSAAFAALENPEMELTTKNIMGIVVPEIDSRSVKKRIDERGYGIIGTSSRIDEAAEAFEDLVEDIVIAAEIETTMRRLLDEIEKTRRRVNALEFRVIPNLESQEAFIRLRLEELERENIFRLKRFKEA